MMRQSIWVASLALGLELVGSRALLRERCASWTDRTHCTHRPDCSHTSHGTHSTHSTSTRWRLHSLPRWRTPTSIRHRIRVCRLPREIAIHRWSLLLRRIRGSWQPPAIRRRPSLSIRRTLAVRHLPRIVHRASWLLLFCKWRLEALCMLLGRVVGLSYAIHVAAVECLGAWKVTRNFEDETIGNTTTLLLRRLLVW